MRIKHLFILPLVLSAVACGAKANNDETGKTEEPKEITISDSVNREHKIIPGSYKRVVCIGAGALRLYSYIGDVNLLAGVEDIDNETLANRPKMFDNSARPYVIANSEVFSKLPSCGVGGPKAQAAESEKILNCNPDIVLSLYEDATKADALEAQLGVPVVTFGYGQNGVFDAKAHNSIKLLGQIFNKEERATSLVNYINSEKDQIYKLSHETNETSSSFYICGLGNWGTTDHLMTAQNYEPFNIANINNVVKGLSKDGVQKIEKEKFEDLGSSIDKMIVDAAAMKNILPAYSEDRNLFKSCKAFNDGNVYLELPYNAYYTNLELALANTWFAASLAYPNTFKDMNIKNKLDEITEEFLGKKLSDEIYSKETSFDGYGKINFNDYVQQ